MISHRSEKRDHAAKQAQQYAINGAADEHTALTAPLSGATAEARKQQPPQQSLKPLPTDNASMQPQHAGAGLSSYGSVSSLSSSHQSPSPLAVADDSIEAPLTNGLDAPLLVCRKRFEEKECTVCVCVCL